MVSELASWSSESSPESSLELLSESSLEEMRSTSTTLLPGSSLEKSALTSMRVDRFFLHVEEKNPASPWRASLESANLALVRVYGFLPGPTKNRPLPWSVKEDARRRCAGTAPLRHHETSLS
jgi:hypothetical protein